jgi:hypothetical protein
LQIKGGNEKKVGTNNLIEKKTQIDLLKMESTTPAKGSNGVEAAAGTSSKNIGISSSERLSWFDIFPWSICRN